MPQQSNNRDALLKLATQVRPALSTQSFIPALTHIRLGDGFLTAFNDVTSISVACALADDLKLCVPGELLIRALGSFSGNEVLVQEHATEDALVLSSGRAKLKLPVLPFGDFPFAEVKGEPFDIDLTASILTGIQRCLFSVSNDPTHPAQMGVTLDSVEDKAVLYSTDNHTISRYATSSAMKLPGGVPIILPTFFCEQLLSLSKAYAEDGNYWLEVFPGALRAVIGDRATLLTRTVVDLEPLDFDNIIAKYVKIADLKATLRPIPDNFDSAFNRALLVLNAEPYKATQVTVGNGSIALLSRSALGEAEDDMEWRVRSVLKPFSIDPSLVVRAAKSCGSIAFFNRIMLLASDDATFIHLISHCSA